MQEQVSVLIGGSSDGSCCMLYCSAHSLGCSVRISEHELKHTGRSRIRAAVLIVLTFPAFDSLCKGSLAGIQTV